MAETFIDLTNSNNHAAQERMAETEKVERMRKKINDYRVELNMREKVATMEVIDWLRWFEKILDDVYAKAVSSGEIDRLRQDYFLVAKKKPFMAWGVEELKAKIAELQNNPNEEINKNTLNYKKWKNARK